MPRPKKQKAEPVHIVREWESSPIVYGYDSRERTPNPDFHPPIRLTSKGEFVDERLLPIDPKNVPDRIRTEAKKTDLNTEYRPPKTRELSMRDAMLGSGVSDTDPDPAARRAARAFA